MLLMPSGALSKASRFSRNSSTNGLVIEPEARAAEQAEAEWKEATIEILTTCHMRRGTDALVQFRRFGIWQRYPEATRHVLKEALKLRHL